MSKIEQKILKEINLTEGFLTKVLAKIFKPRVEKTDRNYCKKRPQSPLCGIDGRRKPF